MLHIYVIISQKKHFKSLKASEIMSAYILSLSNIALSVFFFWIDLLAFWFSLDSQLYNHCHCLKGHPLQVRHKQGWGQGFILLLPQAVVLPRSDQMMKLNDHSDHVLIHQKPQQLAGKAMVPDNVIC